MASLTLDRAKAIVEHAEGEFASGRRIDDAFEPFADGGAASRSEARNALLMVVADHYQMAALGRSDDALKGFRDYARSSRFIATRIVCDEIRSESEVARHALDLGTAYESFLVFLTTLDPSQVDFWPKVFARLGLPRRSAEQMDRWVRVIAAAAIGFIWLQWLRDGCVFCGADIFERIFEWAVCASLVYVTLDVATDSILAVGIRRSASRGLGLIGRSILGAALFCALLIAVMWLAVHGAAFLARAWSVL